MTENLKEGFLKHVGGHGEYAEVTRIVKERIWEGKVWGGQNGNLASGHSADSSLYWVTQRMLRIWPLRVVSDRVLCSQCWQCMRRSMATMLIWRPESRPTWKAFSRNQAWERGSRRFASRSLAVSLYTHLQSWAIPMKSERNILTFVSL